MHTDHIGLRGRLLSTRHACQHVDMSKASLYRAARRGDLHPIRLGRHCTRWPVTDLDSWVERAAVEADTERSSKKRAARRNGISVTALSPGVAP